MTDQELELAELLEEVRLIDVQARRLVTDVMSGGYSSAFRGSGIEFDHVREYVDGDSPRSIDWNVTARMGRPFIKTYVDERELTVLFLLDLSESMQGGFGLWSARQAAARVCACLALSATRNNDKVGLIAFSDGIEKYVPPAKGVGHTMRIVRDCLALRGGGARTDMRPALNFAADVVRRHAVVFLVSDFLADDWQRSLGLCARRHDVVAVRLLTPELVPPGAGLLRVRDPESGVEQIVDWGDERVRAAFEERARAHRAGTESDLRRMGVDLMDVPISRGRDREMIARPIMRFFRMRQARGAKR